MSAKWSDIESAFLFAESGGETGNKALISKTTGAIYYRGDYVDDVEESPEDIDGDAYIALPGRRDLDLDAPLVDRFAEEIVPQYADDIRDIFERKGAYRRFKDYLVRVGELDRWHKFERAETEESAPGVV